jgi:hypothetical protein
LDQYTVSEDVRVPFRFLIVMLAAGFAAACATEAPNSAPALERCMSVDLMVNVTDEGAIEVNGAPSDRAGLVAAARAKDAVCDNAGAMVLFSRPAASSPNIPFVRTTLMQEVENLALIEATRGDAAEPESR